jgi:hypothetical protein
MFLVKDRLAKLNALTADINVAGPFNEWSNIAVAFPAK